MTPPEGLRLGQWEAEINHVEARYRVAVVTDWLALVVVEGERHGSPEPILDWSQWVRHDGVVSIDGVEISISLGNAAEEMALRQLQSAQRARLMWEPIRLSGCVGDDQP